MRLGERPKRWFGRTGGRQEAAAPQAFAPGDFYSPVVSARELLEEPDASRIWPDDPGDPPGIDLRADAQLALLKRLGAFELTPTPSASGAVYDPANDQFPPHDAALLYAMVRHIRPQRMIEVGSGWSTTVAAAAIGQGALSTQLTSIEPYPRDFLRTMGDVLTLREEKVEHTPMSLFGELAAGDVLFIDSSHVVKTGSDVVHLMLHVVPRLAPGVVVHLHDVFLPDDYPQEWVRSGFNWNEQYLLQAYLVDNRRAHVLAANRWLARRHATAVEEAFGPIDLNGSSFWFVVGDDPEGWAESSRAPVG